MTRADQCKWDRIYTGKDQEAGRPCRVLSARSHLLPPAGLALDLACGRGANALYLAGKGYTTSAWDVSEVVVRRLAEQARQIGVQLDTQQRDVAANPPAPASFDIIVVSRYLERTIIPDIIAALKDEGLLFYQTFIREKVSDTGPRNPAYRLQPNELLHLFKPLHIIYYREEGTTGDTGKGFRNEAMLVAQRRGQPGSKSMGSDSIDFCR